MFILNNRQIVLGITGCIAAYKAVELVRLMTNAGAQVHVIMTHSACEFVAPLTFQTLSGNQVTTELFDLYEEKEIGHISLARRADAIVVAPATANIIGKTAGGIADDMLSTVIMAAECPVLFAPAMNVNMWENPVVQKNVKELASFGYHFVGPAWGDLACGDSAKGRLSDMEAIADKLKCLLSPKDFSGKRVLVSAGPTCEPMDPVRFISNPSSGKTGFSIARALAHRGADVTLVSGPTAITPPMDVKFIPVRTAQEMAAAVLDNFNDADIVIKSAAVSDYRPAETSLNKIKKGDTTMLLKLTKTPDILADLGRKKADKILVGFAAETDDVLINARGKLKTKNLDMIVANDVSRMDAGFGTETNEVKIILADGTVKELPMMTKNEIAHKILDSILLIARKKTA